MAAESDEVTLDGRVFWVDGTLPANWSEDTAFDDRFIQGDDATYTGPVNTNRTTHTHSTIASHTHTGDAHDHDTSAVAASTVTTSNAGTKTGRYAPTKDAHSHASRTSPTSTITYQSNTATVSGTTPQYPPYYRVKVIKPDTIARDIPANALALFDSVTPGDWPTNWLDSDGTDASRPNLDGKFLFGATTGDAMGSTGGSAAHTHTVTNHTHTVDTHFHGTHTLGSSTASIAGYWTFGSRTYRGVNHHQAALISTSLASGTMDLDAAPDTVTTGSGESQPAYNAACPLINKTSGADTPVGIIIGFVGDAVAGDIPSNWALCDGSGSTPDWTDKQLRMQTGSLTGGGSNTHGHTYTHKHTHSEHVHNINPTFMGDITVTPDNGFGTVGIDPAFDAHTHAWTCTGATPTMQNNASVVPTEDLRYNYRTMVFIRKTSTAAGGPTTKRASLGTIYKTDKEVLAG